MSNSCKKFHGVIADDESVIKAKGCLKLALLYIDRTVDPPRFRYMEPDDSYEVLGWKKEDGQVFYKIRLKEGKVLQVNENELKRLDDLIKVRKKFPLTF